MTKTTATPSSAELSPDPFINKMRLHDKLITSLAKVEALACVAATSPLSENPDGICDSYLLTLVDLATEAREIGEKLFSMAF